MLGRPRYSIEVDKFPSLNLTHLMLSTLNFQPAPAFGEFNCLTHLYLAEIRADFDNPYIFHCPVLETLLLADCLWIFHTSFKTPKLKYLYEKNVIVPLSGLENITTFFFVLGVPDITMNCNVSELIGCLQNVEELFIHQYSIQVRTIGECG